MAWQHSLQRLPLLEKIKFWVMAWIIAVLIGIAVRYTLYPLVRMVTDPIIGPPPWAAPSAEEQFLRTVQRWRQQ